MIFSKRLQAPRLPVVVLLCILFCIGGGLGCAVCRAVPQQEQQELSNYMERYAQATMEGSGPTASALSVAVAYFRYPLLTLLLGFTAAGLIFLPLLWALQGFFLSFSTACFAAALGRNGVYLALAAFGLRCLFVLPCTLYLTVHGLSSAASRRCGQKASQPPVRWLGICLLLLLLGMALELHFTPYLLKWVIAKTLCA